MGRCRVVTPKIVRLPLSDGDWIDIKKELNAGEYADYLTDMADRKPYSKIIHYVLGWSLFGLDGQPLPWRTDDEQSRRDTVKCLDKGTVREMIAAIDRHDALEEAELDAKKKTRSSAAESSATLVSVG